MEQITLETKQKQVLDLAIGGKSLFISGRAGTGKSFIVNQIKKQLELQKKQFVVLSTTGVSAQLIGGQTVHSLFGLKPFGVLTYEFASYVKTERRDIYKTVKTIIIDEVSMLRPDQLDCCFETMLKNIHCIPDIQWIFVGDLKQLPPILEKKEEAKFFSLYPSKDFRESKHFKELGVVEIELDVIKRQSDEKFIEALGNIRESVRTEYFLENDFRNKQIPEGEEPVFLTSYRATAEQYNQDKLDKLPGEPIVFKANVNKDCKLSDFMVEPTITVKPGAKVIWLINSHSGKLVNGQVGTFVVIKGKYCFRTEDGINYEIGPHRFSTFDYRVENVERISKMGYPYTSKEIVQVERDYVIQYPIKLAWAITVHKSQGMSLDSVMIDMKSGFFEKGQAYVAFSRCKTPERLYLHG